MLAMACREGGGGGEWGLETRVIHLRFYTALPRDEVHTQPGSACSVTKEAHISAVGVRLLEQRARRRFHDCDQIGVAEAAAREGVNLQRRGWDCRSRWAWRQGTRKACLPRIASQPASRKQQQAQATVVHAGEASKPAGDEAHTVFCPPHHIGNVLGRKLVWIGSHILHHTLQG